MFVYGIYHLILWIVDSPARVHCVLLISLDMANVLLLNRKSYFWNPLVMLADLNYMWNVNYVFTDLGYILAIF